MPSSLAGLGDKQLLIVSGSPSAFTEEERTQEVMRDELRKRQFDGFTEEVVEEVVEDLFDAEVTDPFDEEATDESDDVVQVADVEILKDNRPSPNATIPSPDAPLLERVQLLSTPVIMSLLITFGVLIPILMFGVSALAGIQVSRLRAHLYDTIADTSKGSPSDDGDLKGHAGRTAEEGSVDYPHVVRWIIMTCMLACSTLHPAISNHQHSVREIGTKWKPPL
jgi:hypothetical protein